MNAYEVCRGQWERFDTMGPLPPIHCMGSASSLYFLFALRAIVQAAPERDPGCPLGGVGTPLKLRSPRILPGCPPSQATCFGPTGQGGIVPGPGRTKTTIQCPSTVLLLQTRVEGPPVAPTSTWLQHQIQQVVAEFQHIFVDILGE